MLSYYTDGIDGAGYTGYLKLGARYYNPTTGRFTQPDPSSQEPNAYNYASCNPVNNTDPTGLFGWSDLDFVPKVAAVVAGVAGTVAGGCTVASGVSLIGVVTAPAVAPFGACIAISGGIAMTAVSIGGTYQAIKSF